MANVGYVQLSWGSTACKSNLSPSNLSFPYVGLELAAALGAQEMRLINVHSLELQEFFGAEIPPYAILSHTWGDGEVTYQDWNDKQSASSKAGFAKITGCCRKAQQHDLDWVWVDTNCIDKSSSAELTEAINSMFQWYRKSKMCFAYLSDVPSANGDREQLMSLFRGSRWFTRGWTLQELIAPRDLTFYAADWTKIGSKDKSLADKVSDTTGIHAQYLTGTSVREASLAERMSWLSRRTTKRVEDIAYCMLGLFDINMPLLYGEGIKAFKRLQEEIIKVSNDHTIFCWSWTPSVPKKWTSLLSPYPETFRYSGGIVRDDGERQISTYSMTNAGLSITLPLVKRKVGYFLVLNATKESKGKSSRRKRVYLIPVDGKAREDFLHVARDPFPRDPVLWPISWCTELETRPIMVMTTDDGTTRQGLKQWYRTHQYPFRFGLLLTLGAVPPSIKNLWRIFTGAYMQPSDAYNEYLGTFKLDPEPTDRSSGSIGTCFIRMGRLFTKNSGRREGEDEDEVVIDIYVFLAVKLHRHSTDWYCQVFTQDSLRVEEVEVDMKKCLRNLTRQVKEAKTDQRSHYCEKLDLSIVIGDRVDHSRGEPELRFLYFSGGIDAYLSSGGDVRYEESSVYVDDLEDEALDDQGSETAEAGSETRGQMLPVRGIFRLSGFE